MKFDIKVSFYFSHTNWHQLSSHVNAYSSETCHNYINIQNRVLLNKLIFCYDCAYLMKNLHQQNLKKSAKQYHRNTRSTNFVVGLIQYHQYDKESSSALSWWDDVDFILNDYRVIVAWIHPRQHYKDYVNTEAHKSVAHLGFDTNNIFDESTPNYVKVGQSRKKVSTYTVNFTKAKDEWNAAYEQALEALQSSTTYQAKPYIHKEWLAHGCYVDICAPIEISSNDDLVKLVNLVKRLLKRETTLVHEFPDYAYTKVQFMLETP